MCEGPKERTGFQQIVSPRGSGNAPPGPTTVRGVQLNPPSVETDTPQVWSWLPSWYATASRLPSSGSTESDGCWYAWRSAAVTGTFGGPACAGGAVTPSDSAIIRVARRARPTAGPGANTALPSSWRGPRPPGPPAQGAGRRG